MTNYYVEMQNPGGERIEYITDFISLTYTLTVNAVGVLQLVLPQEYWDLIRRDTRFKIWRVLDNGKTYLEGETVFFARKRNLKYTNKTWQVTVTAYSLMTLLSRRYILYTAGSAQASKASTPADNMVKAIIRENLGSSATDTARRWNTYLSVQADTSLGASLTQSFAWKGVLQTCQDIANASAFSGKYIAFDLVVAGNLFEFRTYYGQRGVDRRKGFGINPLTITVESGSLADSDYTEDWTNEVSYAIACGRGQNDTRNTDYDSDATLIAKSPFGRIEFVQDARNSDTTSLKVEAQTLLRGKREVKTLSANLKELPNLKYGVDFGWGDRLIGVLRNMTFDCYIQTVVVKFSHKTGEVVDVKLQSA